LVRLLYPPSVWFRFRRGPRESVRGRSRHRVRHRLGRPRVAAYPRSRHRSRLRPRVQPATELPDSILAARPECW